VHNAATVSGTQHVRHVRLRGTITWQAHPTNVIGDDGILFGLKAVYPAAAPGVPSLANAGQWIDGLWGRPRVTATELVYLTGASGPPSVRWFIEEDVDYNTQGFGTAGAIYVGHQQLYVDVNHGAPDVSWSFTAWGYQE